MITIRGQILASRTGDDPPAPPCVHSKRPVCRFKTSPCVPAPRAHVEAHVRCRHTRARFECAHGGVFESTHGFFFTFFQCAAIHTTTHTTQHHNMQHHTERDRDRDRQTEKERQDKTRKEKKRQEKRRRDKTRKEKTRQEKRRNEKVKEERRDK